MIRLSLFIVGSALPLLIRYQCYWWSKNFYVNFSNCHRKLWASMGKSHCTVQRTCSSSSHLTINSKRLALYRENRKKATQVLQKCLVFATECQTLRYWSPHQRKHSLNPSFVKVRFPLGSMSALLQNSPLKSVSTGICGSQITTLKTQTSLKTLKPNKSSTTIDAGGTRPKAESNHTKTLTIGERNELWPLQLSFTLLVTGIICMKLTVFKDP